MATKSHVLTKTTIAALPILIVDKEGGMGIALALKTRNDFLTILVTGRRLPPTPHIIPVAYVGKVPRIPDNTFSHIFLHIPDAADLRALLPSFVKKAQKTKARLICLVPLHEAKQNFIADIVNSYGEAVVFVYGEIFGNDRNDANIFNTFLHQAKAYGRITIPNRGLEKLYPVSFTDIIDSVLEKIFSSDSEKRVFLLLPKNPITSLSAARSIQKVHPNIQIDYAKGSYASPDFVVPAGEYVFGDLYPLKEKVKDFDMSKSSIERMVPRIKSKKALPRPLLFGVAMTLLILTMPFITTLSFFFFGGILLQAAKANFDDGNIAQAKRLVGVSENSFVIASETGATMQQFATLLHLTGATDSIETAITAGRHIAKTARVGLSAMEYYESVLSGSSKSPKSDFQKAAQLMRQTLLLSQEMKAEALLPKEIAVKLTSYERAIGLFSATVDIQEDAIGLNKPMTYLVLFQNNMEIRPGGGFIGSYGLLKMEKGSVKSFSIHDVYDADGQLKGHIEPPYALRRYLGVKHWFLRDSNFHINPAENAAKAAYFLELETGEKVDGVVTLNVSLLQKMLSVTGPIHVPEYNEDVTSENFYLLTQSHAEDNFFPGSTQKKDFLRSLAQALQGKLAENGVGRSALLQVLIAAIYERDVALVFQDKDAQKVLHAAQITQTVLGARSDERTISDMLMINEANVGTNKANYYVKRGITHDVSIAKGGEVTGSIVLRYENTSKAVSKFGGDYHLFLQVVLPGSTRVNEVIIDGDRQVLTNAITDPAAYEARGFKAPQGLEVVEETVGETKAHGFFIIILKETSKTIKVSYVLGDKVEADTFTYEVKVLKQSGSGPDPYALSLHLGESYQPFNLPQEFSQVGETIVYSGNLREDKLLRLRLLQKK